MLDAALIKEDTAAQQDSTAGISIEVLDESLPRRLRLSIAEQLQQAQHADKARGSGLTAAFQVCKYILEHAVSKALWRSHSAIEWRVPQPADNATCVLHLHQAASQNFAALLTSIPELVEAYEGADAAGATTRRYAIINEDKQVLINQVGGPNYNCNFVACQPAGLSGSGGERR